MNNEFHIGRGVNMATTSEARKPLGIGNAISASAKAVQPDVNTQEYCTFGQHQRVASFGSYSLGGISEIMAVPEIGGTMVSAAL